MSPRPFQIDPQVMDRIRPMLFIDADQVAGSIMPPWKQLMGQTGRPVSEGALYATGSGRSIFWLRVFRKRNRSRFHCRLT